MTGGRPTTAWIDAAALRANFAVATRLASGRDVIGVVKADGYGHGAREAVAGLADAGCRQFAVATVAEGVDLRAAACAAPILVLGGAHDEREAAAAAASELTLVLHELHQLADYRAAGRSSGHRMPIQLEVDTGMARAGLPADKLPTLLAELAEDPVLRVDGMYTHLASADEADLTPTRDQLRRFEDALSACRAAGPLPRQIHVANSAGLLASTELEDAWPGSVNAVRPGLMLYGVYPSKAQQSLAELRPVMTLTSAVAHLRDLPAGESVGYGATWRTKTATRIATLPIGYADGVPWTLANAGEALVRGRRVPIVGRISMDLTTLDVGPEAAGPIALHDEVTLFGQAPAGAGKGEPAPMRVEELAAAAGTLSYEVLVSIGSRVPRKVRGHTETPPGER